MTLLAGTSAPPALAPAGTGTVELLTSGGWFAVCATGDLEAGRGVAVLLPDGAQAAVFKDSTGRLYAIGNVDPFTGAGVLCHGLLGSAGGRPYVASPLLKQRFALEDGRCLDDDGAAVACYPLRLT
ncbi:nitrite reductase small subunit NirD [Streptomyces sp. NPDC020917]|uniref:nitrite reductase small subunit NirD n=1 Tax=Streptomyces sp. NPDC020917 TaxID=3365102 RepID=UPI003790D11C